MNNKSNEAGARDRRTFLKEVAAAGGALMLPGSVGNLQAQIASNWRNQIGLELFTVRGLLNTEYEGTLAKLAAMGYKEVEPADPYNKMEPAQYKALLDKYGLKMYSTHSGASDGPGLEKQLEGQQLMGLKYSSISAPRPAAAAGGAPAAGVGVRAAPRASGRRREAPKPRPEANGKAAGSSRRVLRRASSR